MASDGAVAAAHYGKHAYPSPGLGDARRLIGHHRLVHPTLVRLAYILSLDLDRNMANAGSPHGCPAQHFAATIQRGRGHRTTFGPLGRTWSVGLQPTGWSRGHPRL